MISPDEYSNQPIRLIQISDSHLFADPQTQLLGINTQQSLQQVLAQVKQDHPNPDLLLLTGDLAQEADELTYRRLEQTVASIGGRGCWLPGNHDDPKKMQQLSDGYFSGTKQLFAGEFWQLILLNTKVPGEVHGFLEQSELDFLEACLKRAPERYSLICMHHHPVNIGSQWMDNINCRNGQQLLDILTQYPNTRAVTWGHIHQDFHCQYQHLQLFSAPSTCIQFLPGSNEFAVDPVAPGYRWIELSSSGTIKTGVSRIEAYQQQVVLESEGY